MLKPLDAIFSSAKGTQSNTSSPQHESGYRRVTSLLSTGLTPALSRGAPLQPFPPGQGLRHVGRESIPPGVGRSDPLRFPTTAASPARRRRSYPVKDLRCK